MIEALGYGAGQVFESGLSTRRPETPSVNQALNGYIFRNREEKYSERRDGLLLLHDV